jgi:hypothetical protein
VATPGRALPGGPGKRRTTSTAARVDAMGSPWFATSVAAMRGLPSLELLGPMLPHRSWPCFLSWAVELRAMPR